METNGNGNDGPPPNGGALNAEMAEINKNLMKVLQINQQVKAVTPSCETCGGPHSYNDCPAIVGHTQNVYATGAYNQGGNSYQPQGNHNLLSYRSDNYFGPPGFNQNQNRSNPNQNYQNKNQGNNHGNPQGNNQGRNQFFQGASHGQNTPPAYQAPAYQALGYQAPVQQAPIPQPQVGPTIPTTSSPPKVVERETEMTKDTVPPTNNESTKDVQPLVVQVETQILNSKPVVAPVVKPVEAPVSAPKPNPKPSIPYSFADALILMPKFALTTKSLLTNKEKLFELARIPLNEHCSAVLLIKLPEKLEDLNKFLIPCDFPGMYECLALFDLGASINLMPLSVWNKLSLPELSPTCKTLELADRSISRPVRVAEDVFVKVGKFHFSADFVVVDFDANPRVPLILRRSFLKTGRSWIDVYEGELTLRVGKEAVTFNLDQTSRYSAHYDAELINQIDVIDVACEEYSQEILGFSMSGNPTPSTEPIVLTSSPTLTPFGDSDFLLEETDAFLAIEDEPISLEIDDSFYDSEGKLKVVEPKNEKYSIDEPPVVELKDLPPHLEYEILEGDDKLPVIIAKDLKDEEKTALIKVLESHKQALAWQLFDIKGINLEFYTHKILMEDDFKPAFQHQRRNSFKTYLSHLDKMLKRCEDTNLCLNWEKSHFMVKEGIILGHKISKNEIEGCRPNKRTNSSKTQSITFGTTASCLKSARIKSSGGVFMARKSLIFLRLATMDPPGDIMARTTLPKRCLTPVSIGPQSIVMPMTCSNLVTLVNVREKFHNVMKCLKIPSKFASFDEWGIDFMGPFPSSRGNKTPRAVISDRGTHFCNDQFAKVMLRYGVTHRLATAYHPQTSGQVEVSNRGLKRILERTVGKNRASWSDKLDDALWNFHTTFKTPIGCTPYKLVRSPESLIYELNELRDQAYENSLIYKQKTKRIHDSKIKDRIFNVGDRVLLFNSRLKIFSGKLKTRWTGPFTITQVFPYGTVELS
uniref:Integrase catalytic domain-containing protein n=1 Tax=Tanacetum cinerariifolium TaxID=118510 RepID=A0A6L2LLX4_TANCI|nr:hypothetical protein [Tanacetum cinerariifolium]